MSIPYPDRSVNAYGIYPSNRGESQECAAILGPRSVEGKAVSRFNSLKTGIHAKSLVIPGEDPAELEALTADYRAQFRPASPLENFLVDALVAADWKLRRLRGVEAELWTQKLGKVTQLSTYSEQIALAQASKL